MTLTRAPASRRPHHADVADKWRSAEGERVEVFPLVGGGAPDAPPTDRPLVIGKFRFTSRLITGTGKYSSYDVMRDCLAASGCQVTTVAVRRERLLDKEGR